MGLFLNRKEKMVLRSKTPTKVLNFIDNITEMKNDMSKNVNMVKNPSEITDRRGLLNKVDSFLGKYVYVKDFDKRSKEGFDKLFKDFDISTK